MSKKLIPKQLGKVLYALTHDKKGSDLDKAIQAFVLLLQKHQMIKKVDYIVKEFESFAKEETGIKQLDVKSTRNLTKNELESINKAWGGKAEINCTVDKTLVGGIVIKDGNVILDGSVKTQLEQLQKHLV
jgi:F-type H+-transporting ATPase subunit delta